MRIIFLLARDVTCPSTRALLLGMSSPLMKLIRVLYKKQYTGFRVEFSSGRRRSFVSTVAVFTNEEVSPPEESFF